MQRKIRLKTCYSKVINCQTSCKFQKAKSKKKCNCISTMSLYTGKMVK